MENEKYQKLKLGERGAMLSIIAYVCLSTIKLIIGYTSDSAALRADGLNNATDIVASIAVLVGLRLSQKPPDTDHSYGHWKSETIASMIASFIIIAVGVQVLVDNAMSILQGNQESPDMIAAYVGIASAIVMFFVYRFNKKLAGEINSKGVMAAAKDNLSDALVSVGVVIGVVGSQLNMPWLDTITAFIIGLLIVKTGWSIFKEASHELTDGFDEKKLQLYEDAINKLDGVIAIKEIKGRNYGNNEVLDIVILVSTELSISEAHHISTNVEKALIKEYEVHDVHVHVEPNEPE